MAAVVAGTIALMAPCCVSVMLPTYFAASFHNRRMMTAMTFVFAAAIATVIVPIALGASLVRRVLIEDHTTVYLLGGRLMVGLGVYTLLGGRLRLPTPGGRPAGRGPLGVYGLGVLSGVASSCCAHVLAGVERAAIGATPAPRDRSTISAADIHLVGRTPEARTLTERNLMRCMNPKILAGILVAGVAVFFLFPGVGQSIGPLLIVGACLSMIAMMVVMGRSAFRNNRGTGAVVDPQGSTARDSELAELRAQLARLEGTDCPAPDRG